MPSVVAASTSEGFSLPVVIAAAGVAFVWVAGTAALWVARRPPHADPAPPTMELGAEPPAVASLLCDDYVMRTETAPATLLDLAARAVISLEEVQPGETVCRVAADPPAGLAPFELHVLAALRAKAIDGIVPATALTTGTADASAHWHRQLEQMVVVDAQHRGLTIDRWPKGIVRLIGAGVVAIVAILLLSAQIGGNAEDHPLAGGIALAGSILGILVISTVTARFGRSLAQRPTPAGSATEACWLGVRAHLAQNEQMEELPPAAVKLYGRHLAYAAGFGLADHAVTALPFGEEDDHLAWSPQGGRWRRVRVRYPRVRPPVWGRHPALATLLGLFWSAVAVYAIVRAAQVGVGRGGLIAEAVFSVLLLWSVWVLVQAVPDLFTRRPVTGTVLRCRARPRVLSQRDSPKFWYYVAVDDGSKRRIAAYRVDEELYGSVRQGQTVTADVTPRLGYVRSFR